VTSRSGISSPDELLVLIFSYKSVLADLYMCNICSSLTAYGRSV